MTSEPVDGVTGPLTRLAAETLYDFRLASRSDLLHEIMRLRELLRENGLSYD